MGWPYKDYQRVSAYFAQNNESRPGIIGEYAMVREFGMGFYDLDEITAQEFALIYSIENLNQERQNPPKR